MGYKRTDISFAASTYLSSASARCWASFRGSHAAFHEATRSTQEGLILHGAGAPGAKLQQAACAAAAAGKSQPAPCFQAESGCSKFNDIYP